MSQNDSSNKSGDDDRVSKKIDEQNNLDSVINNKEKKKVRRAFSMPRNPFRLSQKIKITKEDTDSNMVTNKSGTLTSISQSEEPQQEQPQKPQRNETGKARVFRRSSWKKFVSRIAQQMTSINIGVSIHSSFPSLFLW